MHGITTALRDAWRIGAPWFGSEEKWRARGLLLAIIGLNLALVGMNVVLSFWNRAFYDSLETRNADAFWQLLLTARTLESGATMPGFVPIVVVYLIVAVYAYYLRQGMEIRWRRWMTTRLLADWLDQRAYYRIGLLGSGNGSGVTDNPDQRIAEDLRIYVTDTLTLGLGLMTNIVTLVSFVGILWSLSGAMTVLGVEVPGYMVWMALIYATAGTLITHWIGRRLIPLNFEKQRREADFRFALVRLRENTEGVALYGGEADESRRLHTRFGALMDNWWRTMRAQKRLLWFTTSYGQAAVVFPFIVAAPQYLSGGMSLGQLTQTAGAFGRVQDALSWFVDSYTTIAEWRATVARITGFRDAIAASREARGPALQAELRADVALEDVSLMLPDGRSLLSGATARFAPGESVLITGASGSGKSTLFRALAGIWPFGGGTVRRPLEGRALLLPQRPYIPLGTLRAAVAYPDAADAHDQAAIAAALTDAGLAHLIPRLEEEDAWSQRLSGGEQQRLAVARALLLKPDWLFLDEATASLDPEAERAVYAVLRERLPGSAIISIAHRPAVAEFHDRKLRLEKSQESGRLAAVPAVA